MHSSLYSFTVYGICLVLLMFVGHAADAESGGQLSAGSHASSTVILTSHPSSRARGPTIDLVTLRRSASWSGTVEGPEGHGSFLATAPASKDEGEQARPQAQHQTDRAQSIKSQLPKTKSGPQEALKLDQISPATAHGFQGDPGGRADDVGESVAKGVKAAPQPGKPGVPPALPSWQRRELQAGGRIPQPPGMNSASLQPPTSKHSPPPSSGPYEQQQQQQKLVPPLDSLRRNSAPLGSFNVGGRSPEGGVGSSKKSRLKTFR